MLATTLTAAIRRGLTRLGTTSPSIEQIASFDGRLVASVDRRAARYLIALERVPIATGTGSLALALDQSAGQLDRTDRAAAACARELADRERERSWRRRLQQRHRAAA
jgi:hypothetical protein